MFIYDYVLQEIVLGMSEIALVGGTESMSGAPYAVRNVRFGTRLGQDLKVGFISLSLVKLLVGHKWKAFGFF